MYFLGRLRKSRVKHIYDKCAPEFEADNRLTMDRVGTPVRQILVWL